MTSQAQDRRAAVQIVMACGDSRFKIGEEADKAYAEAQAQGEQPHDQV